MNHKHIHVYHSPDDIAKAVADHITKISSEAIRTRNRFTIAFSGGSVLDCIGSILCTEPFHTLIQWDKWHVFFSDERCVPLSDTNSNYKKAHDLFLKHVTIPYQQIYTINDTLSAADAAQDYQSKIAHIFQSDDEFPSFDLILLGVGEDGHTASLFPNHPVLDEKKQWIAYIREAPKPPSTRITFTIPLINHAYQIFVILFNQAKANILASIIKEDPNEDTLPIKKIRPMHGTIDYFVDEAAMNKSRNHMI
jgi:6-phosphogluconolactonase